MLIVGNKIDRQSTERCVSTEEGSALADEFGAAFMEISVLILHCCQLTSFV